MNNYYTLRFLVTEFNDILLNATFEQAVSFRKNRLEIYFQKAEESFKLMVSTDPSRQAIFLDSAQPPRKRNTVRFFQDLQDQKLTKISLDKADRLITMQFNQELELMFLPFGSHANVVLIRKDSVIASFKRQNEIIGIPKPQARVLDQSIPEWKGDARAFMLAVQPRLPRTFLNEIIQQHHLQTKSPSEILAFVKQLENILLEQPVPESDEYKQICLIPDSLLKLNQRIRYTTCNDAVRDCFFAGQSRQKLEQRMRHVETLLQKIKQRTKHKYEQLQNAVTGKDRAEHYEQLGHILMANMHIPIAPESTEMEASNFYSQGEMIRIPLFQGLSIQESAAKYYQKSKDARTSREVAITLFETCQKEWDDIRKAEKIFDDVRNSEDLDAFEQQFSELLDKNRPGKKSDEPSHNFGRREYLGFEFFIGRNATNNDELLRVSHKEDIWFHARGVAGSHVILKMGGNKNFPNQEVLEIGASLAAGHSKASGSNLVPVKVAKRKHVRKRKGDAPGAVIVDKEKVLMVEPRKKI